MAISQLRSGALGAVTALAASLPLIYFSVSRGEWIGIAATLGAALLAALGRTNASSGLLLLGGMGVIAVSLWGDIYVNPGGTALLLAPLLVGLIMIASHLGLLSASSTRGMGPSFASSSLIAMFLPPPWPILGFAWAAAGGITSEFEAFSTPLIPPASYALTYVLEAMLSGAPLGGEIPLRPLAFYSSFINNINAYANPFTISVLAISLSLFAASPLVAMRRRALVPLSSLLSVLAVLILAPPPSLPAILILYLVTLALGFIGLTYVTDMDVIPILYGHLASIPTSDELRSLYRENWEGLIGMDAAKRELMAAAASFNGGGKGRVVRPVHGVLLYGPSGTGKTALGLGFAAWLGLERGFRVLIIRTGALMRGGPWSAAHRLYLVFRLARALQPSIVYIDEVDALGRARGEADSGGYRLVGVLLQEIDGTVSRFDKVMVVATTNVVESLDPALVRPGRLGDLKIFVPKPPPDVVAGILMGVAQQRGVPLPDWLLREASQRVETGAEAEALVNCVAIKMGAGAGDDSLAACLAGTTTGINAYETGEQEEER
ncbi:hypothetical protein GCM10007981_07530 [Thermocladium modestius]|uniref:AAA+ ATPase domain-containing protein n=1 Tax=Thermocladium modestius TaxID=62609 RepID=A0A830GXI8_9CREN|nr:ATP-binding protein [Thermocladium modestius]GGP20243.1 hypothetical protein GCM10007981_07530 [Thermocladium modestius]